MRKLRQWARRLATPAAMPYAAWLAAEGLGPYDEDDWGRLT